MRLHKIIVLLSDLEHLLSRAYQHPKRTELIWDYLRIRAKASLNRWFHFKEERFLSYHVDLLDYEVFLAEFRQIFVRHTYYVKTESSTPRIIDGGGNMGMSVLYFKYLYPQSRITVFEPSKEVLALLERNISKNQLTDVTVIAAGLSDKEGELLIYPRGSAACGNTLEESISATTALQKAPEHEPYRVPIVLLSNYLKEPVDFLKLDIEGSEGAVIQELEETHCLTQIKMCAMEYHYYPQAPKNNLSDLLQRFTNVGYGTQIYFEDTQTAAAQFDLFQYHSYSLSLRIAPLELKKT
jgi:FkbM family methyltransferase